MGMLSLRQLEAFYWTLKLGSFTRAAGHLKMTQSAVSMRISELETHLKVELFHRGQRRPVITPQGRELARFAEQILRLCSEAQERVSNADLVPEVLRIGFAEVISMTWLPKLVREIHARYPKVQLILEEGLVEEVLNSLKRGSLDLALAAGTPRADQVHFVALGKMKYEWMASPKMRLPRKRLTPRDLQKLPIIGLSKESIHYETISDWFAVGSAGYQPIYTCKSMHVASVLAASRLGVTVLPTNLYRDDVRRKRLAVVQVKPPLPPIEFFAMSSIDNLDPFVRDVAELAEAASDFDKSD